MNRMMGSDPSAIVERFWGEITEIPAGQLVGLQLGELPQLSQLLWICPNQALEGWALENTRIKAAFGKINPMITTGSGL